MAAKTRPIFNNFSSGEISPKIDGRIDLTQYFNGVQTLRNWLCVPQGGAKTRGGFHFVAATNNAHWMPIFFDMGPPVTFLSTDSVITSIENLGGGIVLAAIANSSEGMPEISLVRSTDYGITWTELYAYHEDLYDVTTINSLLSLGGGIVLAGTWPDGKILRSTDYGLNWSDLGQQYSQTSILSLVDLGGGKVLAGTSTGGKILRSTDYGATWSDLGQQYSQNYVRSFADLGGGIVIAGTGTGGKILRSTDYGATWSDLGQQYSQTYIASLASLGGGIAIAGTYNGGKILRSTDYGATWSDLGQQLSETYIMSLADLGDGMAFAGTYVYGSPGGSILISMDYGATWVDQGQRFGTTINDIFYDEYQIGTVKNLGDGIVLAGTGNQGKILRSVNYGGNTQARLIPFQFSELQNYMLEFGDQYIRFFMNCGQIMVGDAEELVTNGTFPAGIASWSTILSTGTGAVTWDTNHMEISGGAAGIGWAEQEITTVDDESIYLLEFDVTAFPLTLRIGTTTGEDDILADTIYAVGVDHQVLFTANGTSAFIQFKNAVNNLAELDNVSCQLAIPYHIDSPYYAVDDLWSIRFVQDDENLYLVHPLYPPQILTKGVGHTSFTIKDIEFIDGPYYDEEVAAELQITSSNVGVGSRTWVAGTEHITNGVFGADTDWDHRDGDAGSSVIAGGVCTLVGGTGPGWIEQDIATVIGAEYYIKFDIATAAGVVQVGSVSKGSDVLGPIAVAIGAGQHIHFTATTTTSYIQFKNSVVANCVLDNVFCFPVVWHVGHEEGLWRHFNVTWAWAVITTFTDHAHVTVNQKVALGNVLSTKWREGCWCDLNGFPRAICFHEGKLLFASTYESPQTIWASKTAKYNDFTPGVLDNDAYSFTPSDLNIIRWISSGRVLSIGALNAEATAVGPSDGPITAVDPPRIKSETTHGSSDLIAPVKVGKAILFLQKAARKIREFVYSYTEDAYGAPDITMVSEHLFDLDILDLVYQQEPDSILWALRADGVLLPCTYDRTLDPTKGGIVGWAKAYTDGLFESIATIPYQDKDQLWAIVIRTIGGVTKRYIEYYDPDICVDSGLTYSGAPTATISGLEHLVGKSVVIVGDGAPYPAQIVPASGELTIDPPASEIYVGLAYTPTMVTNRPEVQIGGTSQGLMKAWNKIIVRVLETTGITINGQVVPARTPADLMGSAPVPFTGDVPIANLGWDTEGKITIIQPLPLPAHVISITGDLVVGDT